MDLKPLRRLLAKRLSAMTSEEDHQNSVDSQPDDEMRPRSRSASSRPNYTVDADDLDLKEEEDDDEYQDDLDNEEGVDGEEEVENAPVNQGGKRGRPSKRGRAEYLQDENKSETEESRSGSALPGTPSGTKKPHFSFPVDDMGAPLPVVNEEYDLPDDDEGETKITKNGELLGGRQFLVRSFTLIDKGRRRFMLSTEPARAVGFRDSYLFFQYHPNLYKYIISQEQKNDLIDRSVLPYSYRNRQIALVTARSVFKEFGARIIVNGRNITDDYYATRLREEGRVIEGSYAREPPKKAVRSVDGLDYAVGAVNPAKNAVEFFDKRNLGHNGGTTATSTSANKLTATNWLYQHAAACSRFNSDLYYDRVRVLLIEQQGLRDPYTNTLHIPQSTQSTAVVGTRKLPITFGDESKDDYQIKYETIIADPDLTRNKTGLLDIPSEIYENVVSDEVRNAIREQQEFEKRVF
ncbi:NPL6 (YMR091C) [Zygosaccharomyces parabailii]|nr:NPL6 (YMR091C) [Zygosaccharomyces parabailii]